jgi:serine/threonine-protein kinase HipA
MTQHLLGVFDGPARVGAVAFESLEERFSFEYHDTWRTAEHSYSISPHILANGPSPASSTVRRFLENLLPEGRALDIVATTHRVSKNNLYALVRELGHETSGALSFLPEDSTPADQPTTRREISRNELQQRISDRAQIPFAVWDGRVRLSIAGYQDKLAVYEEDGRMYLAEGKFASTHILKPEPAENGLSMLVANEHFSMSLATRLNLSAAPVSIIRVPDPVLVIGRFDRTRVPGGVRRLHIIDVCQALNFPVSYKYERNFGSGRDVREIRDGVSFERLFSVVEHTVPMPTAKTFHSFAARRDWHSHRTTTWSASRNTTGWTMSLPWPTETNFNSGLCAPMTGQNSPTAQRSQGRCSPARCAAWEQQLPMLRNFRRPMRPTSQRKRTSSPASRVLFSVRPQNSSRWPHRC